MNIPKEHQSVMPYLILNGASRFIDFTQKVFQAELISTHVREDQTTIMHAEVSIGGSTIMFAEAAGQFKEHTAHLFVYVENADNSFQAAKDNGATVLTELSDQEYGRTCGVTDPTGNVWWITSVK
jgi:PhnB protein